MIEVLAAGALVFIAWAAHASSLPAEVGFGPAEAGLCVIAAVIGYGLAVAVGAGAWTSALIAPAAFSGAVSALSDFRLRLTPDLSSLLVFASALAHAILQDAANGIALALVSSGVSALILFVAGRLVQSGKAPAIGSGDILLAAGWGAWLHPANAPYALVAASILGACYFVIRRVMTRSSDPRLAFAPWIVLGFIFVWAVANIT